MTLQGLKFVMLASSDVDRSAAFYRDRLQLKMTARFEQFAFFDCGGTTLVLSGDLGRGAPESGTATELVFGVESVTEAYDELRATGLEFRNKPRAVNQDAWAVNLDDPDGHLLSLYGSP